MQISAQQLAELLLGIARAQAGMIQGLENEMAGVRSGRIIPALQNVAHLRDHPNPTLTDLPVRVLLGTLGRQVPDVASVVRSLKAGQVEYRVDKAGIVQVPVGKVSFGATKLLDNVQAVVGSLLRAKPSSSKGQYVLTACLSSTMGPGVRIDPGALRIAV